MNIKTLLKIAGPGLLYAGAAVGVSHLVQSTRAGADYGLDLLWILIIVNIIKYPFFEFGIRHANSTGLNLIEGYRQIGMWAVVLFALLTIATMFAIVAAVTIVTAGIAGNIFGFSLSPVYISIIILLCCSLILVIGRYSLLDKLIKWVIIILVISTIIAVIAATGEGVNPTTDLFSNFSWRENIDIFFLIAFIGWMPAPIDVTVWQSMWTLAKNKELGFTPILKNSLLEFKIGYIGTAIIAICFLILGALVMFGSGESLSPRGVLFAGQLINLYTNSIGSWAYYIIAIAALTTMFSTTITVLDAYPRVLKSITSILFSRAINIKKKSDWNTWLWTAIIVLGSVFLIGLLNSSMRFMVDLATTVSFITAPLLAFLNYRTVNATHVPIELKPKKWLNIYAVIGIVFLSLFTLFYMAWNIWQ